MDNGQDGFALVSTIPTAELALLRRRLIYTEAALAQLLGGREQLREWFSASELAALCLPGLPTTRQAIGQLALAQEWHSKVMITRGKARRLYHYGALPSRAFMGMIDLVLHASTARPPHAQPARPEAAPRVSADPTPAWVLPLVRLMRSDNLPLEAALRRLPERVPDVAYPSSDRARAVLSALGLLRETG